jgi:hypothetical protein
VFTLIRDHKPELARIAVLEDLIYAESLLHKHIGSLHKPTSKRRANAALKKVREPLRRKRRPPSRDSLAFRPLSPERA